MLRLQKLTAFSKKSRIVQNRTKFKGKNVLRNACIHCKPFEIKRSNKSVVHKGAAIREPPHSNFYEHREKPLHIKEIVARL